jgi:hypothetical protein
MEVRAVVRHYDVLVLLGTPRHERQFVTELEILAPSHLRGLSLSVQSEAPLPAEHVFRRVGARLKLNIRSLEAGRGTSLTPAEGVTRIVYTVHIADVSIVAEEEPNQ